MPLSRTRDYLSIGEVLDALTKDFPDITISKIRFLEAEGLISPERTPSGYRKFYESDVERLRYVLSMQKDHFMPLKVIKQRLADNGGAPALATPPPGPTAVGPAPAPQSAPTLLQTDVALTREELRNAAGLTEPQLASLFEYGLIESKQDAAHDGGDLAIAKAARGLFAYGVEARHLRMFKQMAERETGFFEQVISPIARRRDPEGARQAAHALKELAALARQMREALLRAALDDLL